MEAGLPPVVAAAVEAGAGVEPEATGEETEAGAGEAVEAVEEEGWLGLALACADIDRPPAATAATTPTVTATAGKGHLARRGALVA